jgi:hypothetical protein
VLDESETSAPLARFPRGRSLAAVQLSTFYTFGKCPVLLVLFSHEKNSLAHLTKLVVGILKNKDKDSFTNQ